VLNRVNAVRAQGEGDSDVILQLAANAGNPQMPRRLFHYQRLVEGHLIALLAKRTVKLSRPDAFNDPWDSRVHFSVPSDQPGLRRLREWLAEQNRKRFPQMPEAERRRRAHEFMLNPARLRTNILEMERRMYDGLCQLYRVYCLSEVCDSALMWAHYTGSHTGICLEFDGLATPFIHAAKVNYRRTYPAFDLSGPGYEPLITKSDVWTYEAEWRMIAEERQEAQALETIKTDDGFLTLPPGVLKSIIIGCLASKDSQELVASLVRTHARDVLVRRMTLGSDNYDLIIS
jgi:hypothetical protein